MWRALRRARVGYVSRLYDLYICLRTRVRALSLDCVCTIIIFCIRVTMDAAALRGKRMCFVLCEKQRMIVVSCCEYAVAGGIAADPTALE